MADLLIRWPDGEEEPLTPELGEALRLIVQVMGPGCRYVCRRMTRPAENVTPYWESHRERLKKVAA